MDKLFIQEGSIFENGYGILAKKVMQDKNLSIEAKAIYSYLVTYAGNGTKAWPGVKKILHDLNIGKDRYYKHMKDLTNNGYIKKEERRDENGHFAGINYIIIHYRKNNQSPKNTDKTGSCPSPQNPDTGNPNTENKQPNSSRYNNNNRANNNSSNNKTEEEEARVRAKKKIPDKIQQKFNQVFNRELSVELYEKMLKIYSDTKILFKALKVAEEKADKPCYLLKILKDWQKEGLTSVSSINDYLKERQEKKQNQPSNKSYSNKNTKSVVPDRSLEEMYKDGWK